MAARGKPRFCRGCERYMRRVFFLFFCGWVRERGRGGGRLGFGMGGEMGRSWMVERDEDEDD